MKMAQHAMVSKMAQLQTIANNLANVSTTGFKRDEMFVHQLETKINELQSAASSGSMPLPITGTKIEFEQGSLRGTGQPLDVAISGDGLFAIESPQGEAYTRDGRFAVNSEGVLTSVDGFAVLGEGGQIELDIQNRKPTDIVINDRGGILVDGTIVETLKLVGIDDPRNFEKMGGNLFRYTGDGELAAPENASVRQGFVEGSNVNPINELVAMIEVHRVFETNQKFIQQQDALLGRAVSDIARVR